MKGGRHKFGFEWTSDGLKGDLTTDRAWLVLGLAAIVIFVFALVLSEAFRLWVQETIIMVATLALIGGFAWLAWKGRSSGRRRRWR